MEKEEKEKIISKIKKLLSLGMKDPGTHEAKAAMAKANELMEKYDMGVIDVQEDGSMDVLRENIQFEAKSRDWESIVMLAIEKVFNCRYIISVPSQTHILLGGKTDLEFSCFLFKFVRLQINKLADSHKHTGIERNTYCTGCAIQVSKLLREGFSTPSRTTTEIGKDLIVLKNAVVDKVFGDMFPNTRKLRESKNFLKGSRDTFSQGMQDGHKVRLNRQINNNNNLGRIS